MTEANDTFCGLKVYTYEEFRKCYNLYEAIKTFENLLQYRLSNADDLIWEVCEREHQQYFPGRDRLSLSFDEIFVDAGAYNGEISEAFLML